VTYLSKAKVFQALVQSTTDTGCVSVAFDNCAPTQAPNATPVQFE